MGNYKHIAKLQIIFTNTNIYLKIDKSKFN